MSTKQNPLVSVVIPVYGSEAHIKNSIESILNQSFSDFEVIALNDGSKDNSLAVMKEIKDERLIVIDQVNMGMAPTINKGISLAKGKYIARQDHDDISKPDRLKMQVEFMENNPDVALTGTYAEIIDEKGNNTGRFHRHVTSDMELKATLYFDNPFVHSSVMLRTDVARANTYDTSVHSLLQDFELWFRISKQFKVANIPAVLLGYRELSTGMSRSNVNYSEVVAGQSFIHLLSLMNDISLKEFAFFYHRCFNRVEKMNVSAARQVMAKIMKAFAAKYNRNARETETIFEEINRNFKKVCLDYKVFASGDNSLKKLVSKTERKIFYPRK
jgi:glycosyltransferase involved in cell wall biosynthesis